ncbi:MULTISPECIES: hypothetical protein [unclassified Bradyrhizobium]|uniref:hypothetical protein n=1 Tax=unclassified Bradyrhizobium TaxID=2631580 RepID=UPI0028E53D85|nr:MULTISPECIES: hypothetical protein [unclassified Bradyrhizobium]
MIVWHSSPNTIAENHISILALAETAAAICLSIYLYSDDGHAAHLIALTALSPAVLLQTQRSNQRALRYAIGLNRWLTRAFHAAFPKEFPSSASVGKSTSLMRLLLLGIVFLLLEIYIFALYFVFCTCLVALLISARAFATLLELTLRPMGAIAAVPDNWRKIVLCTDLTTLPELAPGIEGLATFSEIFIVRFSDVPLEPSLGRARQAAGLFYLLIFVYAPASVYRWSIKSTSLIWSPLLWAFRPIQAEEDPLQLAEQIQVLTVYRISRLYSAGILFLFAAKLYLLLAWSSLKEPAQSIPGWDTIAHYLVPEAIPGWHIAAATNAALTWLIFLKAERYTLDRAQHERSQLSNIRVFFAISFTTRNLLTIYTATCTLYLTITLATAIDVSKIRIIGFPW